MDPLETQNCCFENGWGTVYAGVSIGGERDCSESPAALAIIANEESLN